MYAVKMTSQLNGETGEKESDLEIVMRELEKSIAVIESNYKKAVSNLSILKSKVETDELTKLLRRGAFLQKLQRLLDDSKSEGKEVHLLMIDVDHFKRVNDTYGHQTGDDVLGRVSSLVKDYLRPHDLAGRYGGEEIIVAMQASFVESVQIAEGIRRAVGEHHMVSTKQDSEFNVTLSIGIASSNAFGFDAGVLIGEADGALYRAKNEGRDRVVLA